MPLDRTRPWREGLVEIAGWLGRDKVLSETLSEYERIRDSIKEKHRQPLTTARVAFGSYEDHTLWLADLSADELPAREALAAVGGRPFEAAVPPDPAFPGWRSFSIEALELVQDADALFIWSPDPVQRNELLEHPLWRFLPAVERDRALVSANNVGSGSIYTVMECLRLWNQVYSTLA